MVATKSVPAVRKQRKLLCPPSVAKDTDAHDLWKWATSTFVYEGRARLALTMLCHAWSQYCKHYRTETEPAVESKSSAVKATSPMTAWYDRVTKMMFCMGMMPSQWSAGNGSTGDGSMDGLAARGADGGIPGGMDGLGDGMDGE